MVAQSGWLFVFDVFGCFGEEFLDLENFSKKIVVSLGAMHTLSAFPGLGVMMAMISTVLDMFAR